MCSAQDDPITINIHRRDLKLKVEGDFGRQALSLGMKIYRKFLMRLRVGLESNISDSMLESGFVLEEFQVS